MHNVLFIPEILSNIFCHARSDAEWDKRSLARLARTCRTFQEPALDILWANLDSIVPLIKCLPKDLWIQDDSTLVAQRGLRSAEWEIFRKYSRRIWSLRYSFQTAKGHYSDFFRAFSFLPPNQQWFPKLGRLEYSDIGDNDGDADEALNFFHGILGPHIADINWSMQWKKPVNVSILTTLSEACPSMVTAKLSISRETPELSDILSDMICRWNHLEKLECDLVDAKAMRHLAGLTSLSALLFHIHSLQADAYQGFFYPKDKPMFPNLRKLTLRFEETLRDPGIFCIFRAVPASLSMHIDTLTSAHPNDFRNFFLLFDDKDESCGFQRFEIGMHEWDLLDPIEWRLDLKIFKPLLRFHSLTDVDIDIACPLMCDDTSLQEMASAWPNLQKLNMNTRHGSRGRSMVTMGGLVKLLTLCPRLVTLGIVLDTSRVPLTPDRPGRGCCNEAITALNVGDSWIGQPLKVAVVLSDVLPRVKVIHGCWISVMSEREGMRHRRKWTEVTSALATIVTVREQERNHWSGLSGVVQVTTTSLLLFTPSLTYVLIVDHTHRLGTPHAFDEAWANEL